MALIHVRTPPAFCKGPLQHNPSARSVVLELESRPSQSQFMFLDRPPDLVTPFSLSVLFLFPFFFSAPR